MIERYYKGIQHLTRVGFRVSFARAVEEDVFGMKVRIENDEYESEKFFPDKTSDFEILRTFKTWVKGLGKLPRTKRGKVVKFMREGG